MNKHITFATITFDVWKTFSCKSQYFAGLRSFINLDFDLSAYHINFLCSSQSRFCKRYVQFLM